MAHIVNSCHKFWWPEVGSSGHPEPGGWEEKQAHLSINRWGLSSYSTSHLFWLVLLSKVQEWHCWQFFLCQIHMVWGHVYFFLEVLEAGIVGYITFVSSKASGIILAWDGTAHIFQIKDQNHRAVRKRRGSYSALYMKFKRCRRDPPLYFEQHTLWKGHSSVWNQLNWELSEV